MFEELERAIKILSAKITAGVQPDPALKFTQAALNLAHVQHLIDDGVKPRRTKGASAS